jgi:hypothetical protein
MAEQASIPSPAASHAFTGPRWLKVVNGACSHTHASGSWSRKLIGVRYTLLSLSLSLTRIRISLILRGIRPMV